MHAMVVYLLLGALGLLVAIARWGPRIRESLAGLRGANQTLTRTQQLLANRPNGHRPPRPSWPPQANA